MSSELPPTEYFSGINFNPDFYTYFEYDIGSLTSENWLKHFETFGKYEEHRIPNPNYIIKHGEISYVKGSCLTCNKEYI